MNMEKDMMGVFIAEEKWINLNNIINTIKII